MRRLPARPGAGRRRRRRRRLERSQVLIPRELHTERLLLRQWREGDAETLDRIYRDPTFLEYMPYRDAWEQVERFARGWREDGFSLWAAVDPTSDALIGRIGLMRHHDWPESASPVEVGWSLDRDWWGQGLATEGGRAGIECWRQHLDDPLVISITIAANRRSRAVMDRLGLTPRGETYWHGQHVIWYALGR